MLRIDTSDCWMDIGVGQKFMRTLVWHFSQFLRGNLPEHSDSLSRDARALDQEARQLANRFVADMQRTFRETLSETYETLENLSPEGIVDLYVQQNLEDFEADYLAEVRAPCDVAIAQCLESPAPVPTLPVFH